MVWRVRTGQLPVPAQPLSLETQVKPEAAGARRGGAGLTRAGQGRRPVEAQGVYPVGSHVRQVRLPGAALRGF